LKKKTCSKWREADRQADRQTDMQADRLSHGQLAARGQVSGQPREAAAAHSQQSAPRQADGELKKCFSVPTLL
jgi:hypothetical protein